MAVVAVSVACLAYLSLNVVLLAAAHELEAGGTVYPYKDEDWLRYFLPAFFEPDGRPALLITGPSTARENLVLELFASAYPDHRLFQGSLSLGTLEDVVLSLEYIEKVYGDAAVPETLVLGVSPRFVANIPNERPFAWALEAYSPYFGTAGEPGSWRLRPKSRVEGAWSALRFLTQKQASRYSTVLLAWLRPWIPQRFDAAIRDSNLATAARGLPSFLEAGAIRILSRGPGDFVASRLTPYKYRYSPPVEAAGLEMWLDEPDTWWRQVFAWDPADDDAAARARIRKLLDFVHRHEIRLFVVNLPERELSRVRFDPQRYERYRELLTSSFDGVPLLDLRNALTDDEYYDAEHATASGADRLTAIVLEFMREQGLRVGDR